MTVGGKGGMASRRLNMVLFANEIWPLIHYINRSAERHG